VEAGASDGSAVDVAVIAGENVSEGGIKALGDAREPALAWQPASNPVMEKIKSKIRRIDLPGIFGPAWSSQKGKPEDVKINCNIEKNFSRNIIHLSPPEGLWQQESPVFFAFPFAVVKFRKMLFGEGIPMRKKRFWLGWIPVLALAACSSGSTGPAGAVEGYFKALVAKDSAKVISLSCAAWESSAQIDSDTFAVYPAALENLSCKETGRTGDTAVVTCTGKAILDYNGEKQEINFADRTYQARLEGGEWRMCGYEQ
jgi:hypothetical protein